ncbi:MAG: ABC transporter permease [Candidatus Altimarinota bacterium]
MKKILKYIKLSFVSIIENKGRSFLTMLGIIIGIGSVILMTSLGKGAEAYILGSVSSFGSNLVYIQPGSPDQGITGAIVSPDRIKYKDYLNLTKAKFFENVTPVQAYDAVLSYGENSEFSYVIGTTRGYALLLGFYAEKGRFLDEVDVNGASRVMVLGYKKAEELFGATDPIGENVKIKGQNWRVIGVMAPQGGNAFEDYDTMVFVPITAMQTYLFGVDFVQAVMAGAVGEVDDVMEQATEYMRTLHNINNPENDPAKDDFMVMSQDQVLGIFNDVSTILTLFIVAIASISIVVGGIGIMNIMFVSVNQRTREIGLRKAVGASNADILLQFLIEAVVITFLGGLIGVAWGIGTSYLISLLVKIFENEWQFMINVEAVIISALVSIVVGLIFGIYPARKASLQNSIDALRYE